MDTRIPTSTYRLQIRGDLDLFGAARLIDYLADLGIDFVYLSPPFAAREGSQHGYDVVDPARIDPAIGGDAAMQQLSERCRARGLGVMVDIVPNHLATDRLNTAWWDVLEVGRDSPHAATFDIDWDAHDGVLLLPVLGAEAEQIIARGELRIEREGGALLLRYFDLALPLSPKSYAAALGPAGRALEPVLAALAEAPTRADRDRAKTELDQALEAGAAQAVDAELAGLAELRGEDALAALGPILEAQHYRLRFWRGRSALNYRRFFSISELVGLRSEDPVVFERVHRRVLELVSEGRVDALRVDHPDGLRDPIGYTERLRAEAGVARGGAPPFIVLEKILTEDELPRPEFRVEGTTGYDTLRLLDSVFVEPRGSARIVAGYARATGQPERFEEVVLDAKRRVLESTLEAELAALVRRIQKIHPEDPGSLRLALRELIAHFSVYRSYVRPDATHVGGEDRRLWEEALGKARQTAPGAEAALETLRGVVLLEPPVVVDAGSLTRAREVLLKLQQLTGPAAAKGVEDTAFYRWFPLSSLCEVGGSPDRFGIEIETFHEQNAQRLAALPHTLLATSTHDTKRGEDVRARIHALSEIPEEWQDAFEAWSRWNATLKREVNGEPAPDANDEYLIYQTLLGAWPLGGADEDLAPRMQAYLQKCLREAKRKSSWLEPNEAYEAATLDFCAALLDPERSPDFLRTLTGFERRLAEAGMKTSLSRTVLKVALPGVPDFYQGSELWDLSLVDPDNRRPVDWEQHRALLAELDAADVDELLRSWRDGRIKLCVTERTLRARRRHPELFARGAYLPLEVQGPGAERVIAFARHLDEKSAAITCAGRFFLEDSGWSGTRVRLSSELPAGVYEDVITARSVELRPGSELELEALFAALPAALLVLKS